MLPGELEGIQPYVWDGPLDDTIWDVETYLHGLNRGTLPEELIGKQNWILLGENTEENRKSGFYHTQIGSHRNLVYMTSDAALVGAGPFDAVNRIAYWERERVTSALYGECHGYALTDDEVRPGLRLIAITLNGLLPPDVLELWKCLGMPYMERSLYADEWYIIGLVSEPFEKVLTDKVHIRCSADYVELTGWGGIGFLKDITRELEMSNAYRPKEMARQVVKTSGCNLPETPRQVARLKDMLGYISADCSRDTYMRIVWAILSTGWACAQKLALEWSKTAIHLFEQKCFDDLVRDFNPNREPRVSVGTLYHYARMGGWNG